MIESHVPPATPLRSGPTPLYHQLRHAIRDRVASGEWPAGGRIATTRELCKLYGVSHITVTQAIAALVQEGLLTSRQGKGVFVAEPKIEQGPARLISFTEEIKPRHQVAGNRLIRLARTPASEDVAAKLNVVAGDPVVVLERLRLADGEPMGVQTAYLPERLFPGLADLVEPVDSLYGLLQRRFGVIPTLATDTFEPIRVDRAMAALLEIRTGSPAFSVERVTHDQHDRLIEYVVSVLRGDRYKVTLTLHRP